MCRRISPLRNHTQHFVWPSLEIKGTGVWIQLFRIHKTLQISPEFQCFRCAHICYITSGTVNCALTLWEVRSKRNNIWLIRESGAGENSGGWILNSFCWKKPWRLRKWYCYYRCTTEKLQSGNQQRILRRRPRRWAERLSEAVFRSVSSQHWHTPLLCGPGELLGTQPFFSEQDI